jgi:hypothetical protein
MHTYIHTHTHIHTYIHTYIHPHMHTLRYITLPYVALHTLRIHIHKSRDSSVGIALGCGLDDRGSRVRFSAGAGKFSLHHRVQNGSGAQPDSYPISTRGSLPGSKAAGA